MKLASERLLLRPANEGDLDFYVDLRNRPEVVCWSGGEPRHAQAGAYELFELAAAAS